MKVIKNLCLALAVLSLLGAVLAYVVFFDRIENTSRALAGASTGFSFLAFAIARRDTQVG